MCIFLFHSKKIGARIGHSGILNLVRVTLLVAPYQLTTIATFFCTSQMTIANSSMSDSFDCHSASVVVDTQLQFKYISPCNYCDQTAVILYNLPYSNLMENNLSALPRLFSQTWIFICRSSGGQSVSQMRHQLWLLSVWPNISVCPPHRQDWLTVWTTPTTQGRQEAWRANRMCESSGENEKRWGAEDKTVNV